MFLALIVPILLVGLIGLASEGMWLGVLAGVVFIGFVIVCVLIEREDRRARANWIRYWAKGGPNKR